MKNTQKNIFTYLLRWWKMWWRDEFWFNVNLVVNLKNILLLVCEEWHKESRQRTRRMRTSFAHKLTQLHGRYSPCPAHTRFIYSCVCPEWSNVKFCARIHSHTYIFYLPSLRLPPSWKCTTESEHFLFSASYRLAPSMRTWGIHYWDYRWRCTL